MDKAAKMALIDSYATHAANAAMYQEVADFWTNEGNSEAVQKYSQFAQNERIMAQRTRVQISDLLDKVA